MFDPGRGGRQTWSPMRAMDDDSSAPLRPLPKKGGPRRCCLTRARSPAARTETPRSESCRSSCLGELAGRPGQSHAGPDVGLRVIPDQAGLLLRDSPAIARGRGTRFVACSSTWRRLCVCRPPPDPSRAGATVHLRSLTDDLQALPTSGFPGREFRRLETEEPRLGAALGAGSTWPGRLAGRRDRCGELAAAQRFILSDPSTVARSPRRPAASPAWDQDLNALRQGFLLGWS